MDQAHSGLQAALRPHWRAGACAQVIAGGEIRVGDEIAWEEDAQQALPVIKVVGFDGRS
jgi:MOSC domain-containing protein YiiM